MIIQQGGKCDIDVYPTFAAYDAVRLLVDTAIEFDERNNDDIIGNELPARQLVHRVVGDESHHTVHEQRELGDGALGLYTLDRFGDLATPVSYVMLVASADKGWLPYVDLVSQKKICR